jgi:hypothetical protein
MKCRNKKEVEKRKRRERRGVYLRYVVGLLNHFPAASLALSPECTSGSAMDLLTIPGMAATLASCFTAGRNPP